MYTPSLKNDFSKLPLWSDQISSINKNHIHSHRKEIIIDEIDVPCKRINTIILDYGIKHIEYLLIYTEGHDFEILMYLNFNLLKPVNIIFENSHMDGFLSKNERYTKLLMHLFNNGYILITQTPEDTHVKLI